MSTPEIQPDHINRINKAFLFIDKNLESELTLEKIADIAHYSPFHFHRIFRFITGEALNGYITRKRLEKAALVLVHQREVKVTELALQNGFSSNSAFTRAFRKYYGISPTDFRKRYPNRLSKIGKAESKNGQKQPEVEKYLCIIDNLKQWIEMNAKIEIREMQKLDLAYVTSIGEQNIQNAFGKLIKWATPKGLLNRPETKMATIYHDSFKITEPGKVRMSACLILNEPVEAGGEVGLTTIQNGKFVVGSFEIGLDEFEKSWTSLFIWMNENGYKKADRNPFEIYHNNFNDHPEKKAVVDFCIPVE